MHARDLSLDETMTAKIATLHQALARLPTDKSAPAAGRPAALLVFMGNRLYSDKRVFLHERLCQPLQKVIDKRFRDFVRVHFGHTRSKAGVPATPMVTANGGSGGYWRRSAPTIDGVRKRGQPCINAFT
jgi:hypothetical protein